jgi:inosine-uridine nucleoside N-ribohydrolase
VLRSPWFWIAIILIVVGIALTLALGVFTWLIAVLAAAIPALVVAFLWAAFAVGRAEQPQVPHLREIPAPERIPVVYDCDITLGQILRDVGDGLVLLYLLGEPRAKLLCVTTTYGNGPVALTTRTARRLLTQLACDDVETVRGAANADTEPEMNEAAHRLAGIVADRPGEVALIATGSMTNLRHAAALDPSFFQKLRGLYLWGGVTEPLFWNRHRLAERNFSLDPEAAHVALNAGCPVTVATGQAGLTAIFRAPQMAALQTLDDPVSRLVARRTRWWFATMRLWFRDGGFGMWDSVAALALTHPELLQIEQARVNSTPAELGTGLLKVRPDPRGPVRLVSGVKDFDSFILAHFAAWTHLGRRVSTRRKTAT